MWIFNMNRISTVKTTKSEFSTLKGRLRSVSFFLLSRGRLHARARNEGGPRGEKSPFKSVLFPLPAPSSSSFHRLFGKFYFFDRRAWLLRKDDRSRSNCKDRKNPVVRSSPRNLTTDQTVLSRGTKCCIKYIRFLFLAYKITIRINFWRFTGFNAFCTCHSSGWNRPFPAWMLKKRRRICQEMTLNLYLFGFFPHLSL